MRQQNYNYKQYRAALFAQDSKDAASYQDTYIVTDGKNFKLFSIASERNNGAEFSAAFHQLINAWEKEKEMAAGLFNCLKHGLRTKDYCDICNPPIKITKKEAHSLIFNKIKNLEGKEVSNLIDALEVLGLIKFEEEKANILFDCGYIKLEECSKGLVLRTGGEIKWKSWEKYYTKGDRVMLHDSFGGQISGIIKE